MSKTFGTKAVKCNRCEAWTAPSPNHAATGTTCAKCLYPDQPAADRERIAEAMCKAQPGRWWIADEFHELGNAVRAFDVLCEPRGWCLALDSLNGWHAMDAESDRDAIVVETPPTGDHAADVCMLVCEVLDREAKNA